MCGYTKKINRSEACRIRRLLCVTSWVRLCASENLIYTSDILKVEDQFQDDSPHCGLAELSHQVTRVVAAQLQTVKESSQTSTSLTFWCALRTSRLYLSLPKSLNPWPPSGSFIRCPAVAADGSWDESLTILEEKTRGKGEDSLKLFIYSADLFFSIWHQHKLSTLQYEDVCCVSSRVIQVKMVHLLFIQTVTGLF